MEVDVEIEVPAEPLHDRDGAAPAVGHAVTASAVSQQPEHLTQDYAGHGPTQFVIPREQIPQPVRQAQGPLLDRHVGEDIIDEMRRPFGHLASTAPGEEAATLAREGHETILSACGAPKEGEATGRPSTAQEVAELLLDKSRKPLAVPQRRGVRTEGLEIVLHDPVQEGRCGMARFVRARWRRPSPSTGAPRANTPDRSNPAWMPRSRQRGRDAENYGCRCVQIDSNAGGISGHLSA
jgi:hypothetical protein